MKQNKYIEFLEDVDKLNKDGTLKEKYYKRVKYHILDETETTYILNTEKNISIGKDLEGKLYKTGDN